jgi:threonine dehydrogenase-like Zn-dependent dehydrogenase
MKALVWKDNGRVELEPDWQGPDPSGQRIVVRVKAAGICTTDIHMITGELDFAHPPWVLGHEISGIVEFVDAGIEGWQPGDRVIVDPVVTCGSCSNCLSGKKYLCPNGGELGTTYGSGGYGEFVVVKPGNLYRLPVHMSFEEGAMMEPLNCTLGAIERVRNMAGSRVVVFGPGPAGLLFLQLAKAYGALSVTLAGLDDERLALGRQLGADRIINLSRTDDEPGLLPADSFDVAIEASGSEKAVADCFRNVAASGTVVLYGLHGSGRFTIDSDVIVAKDLTVCTCISAPLLWEKGIRLTESGKLDVRRIITDIVPFAEAADVVNGIVDRTCRPIKAVITYS